MVYIQNKRYDNDMNDRIIKKNYMLRLVENYTSNSDNMIFQLLVRDGKEWCMDVFDKFVGAGDSVCLGEAVIRRYQVWKYI